MTCLAVTLVSCNQIYKKAINKAHNMKCNSMSENTSHMMYGWQDWSELTHVTRCLIKFKEVEPCPQYFL